MITQDSVCQMTDHLRLIIKQVLIRREVFALGRNQLSFIDAGLCKKLLFCADIFIYASEKLLMNTALLRCHADDILVIVRNP